MMFRFPSASREAQRPNSDTSKIEYDTADSGVLFSPLGRSGRRFFAPKNRKEATAYVLYFRQRPGL